MVSLSKEIAHPVASQNSLDTFIMRQARHRSNIVRRNLPETYVVPR